MRRTTLDMCIVTACPLTVVSNDYCEFHYMQSFRGQQITPYTGPVNVCTGPECNRKFAYGDPGLCRAHKRQAKRGLPLTKLPVRMYAPAEDRLHAKSRLDMESECIIFTGAIRSDGYGEIKVDGKVLRAHRAAYELKNGPIPEGLSIHHTCANRTCINPDHLQAVTERDNTAEMLERNYYLKRIKQLEAEVAKLNKELKKERSRNGKAESSRN